MPLRALLVPIAALIVASPGVAGTVQEIDPGVRRGLQRLEAAGFGADRIRLRPATGTVRLLRVPAGLDLGLGLDQATAPEARARAVLERFGGAFGIETRSAQLRHAETRRDLLGFTHVRYRQVHRSVPVFASTLNLTFDGKGDLRAVTGVTVPAPLLDVQPRLTRREAASTAVAAVVADHPGLTLAAESTRLVVYRTGLVRGVAGQDRLAFEIEVVGTGIREFVFVDAHTGHVLDRLPGRHEALHRKVYLETFGDPFLAWQEGDPVPAADPEVDNAARHSGEFYHLVYSVTGGGYDSWDGAGGTLHSVVRIPHGFCPNASWDSTTTAYCEGVTSDDIVGHEFGHAYTETTHGLIYAWQPGALNESWSDIWGEALDQLNTNDPPVAHLARATGDCSTAGGGPPERLTVQSPAAIAGLKITTGALFNPTDGFDISGPLVRADDGGGDGGPHDACEPLPELPAGAIALVDDDPTCLAAVKARNVTEAGGSALVIRRIDGVHPYVMYEATSIELVPTVMVGRGDGEVLTSALDTGPVTVWLQRNPPTNVSHRWMMAEDSPGFGGAIRDMWNPRCLRTPGKVSDIEYWCTSFDFGGVHLNSSIPNHAFALLVDGGTYNGHTVPAIGFTRALRLYWRAQSVYQNRVTGFVEHADALELACEDLIGQTLYAPDLTGAPPTPSAETIDSVDCQAVATALAAVEMRMSPDTVCGFEPLLDPATPEVCAGAAPQTLLAVDWEAGMEGFTALRDGAGNPLFDAPDWTLLGDLPDERPGTAVFAATPPEGDCRLEIESGLTILESPPIAVPPDATPIRLRFDHWVAMNGGFDGGSVRIRVNDGAWMLLSADAFDFNGYTGTLFTEQGNPREGEPAFTGSDDGKLVGSWGTSLASLGSWVRPGDTFRLRFETSHDNCRGLIGWYVDDVEVYGCPCDADDDPSNQLPWYPDDDGDGYGDVAGRVDACRQPAGFIADGGDCDDSDPMIHPAGTEVCGDGADNDCNPSTPDLLDLDFDNRTCDVDCNDGNATAWQSPSPVRNLRFWTNPMVLLWDPPQTTGANTIRYQILRSVAPDDFVSDTFCWTTNFDSTSDAALPAEQTVWHYLVRGTNACPAPGSLGAASDGLPREGVCP